MIVFIIHNYASVFFSTVNEISIKLDALDLFFSSEITMALYVTYMAVHILFSSFKKFSFSCYFFDWSKIEKEILPCFT